MTLEEFGAWLGAIDPKATHHVAASTGECTVWSEYRRLNQYADGKNLGGWKVQIDRYTKTKDEEDSVAAAIEAAIEASVDITTEHIVDRDAETGLVRHIYDCEVW